MCRMILLGVLLAATVIGAAEDLRPAFDKSAYRGTLWTQVNPWWPPNKPRTGQPLGGPNYARKIYPERPVEYWAEAMRETAACGMTGWQFELNAAAPGYGYNFKNEILPAAASLGGDFKLAIFLGVFTGSRETAVSQLFAQFDIFADEWRNHPNIYRLDGRPVISVYTPFESLTPEDWGEIIPKFEERFGPAIWLANIWSKTYDVASKPEQLRAYLPCFDGITAYANWGGQDELYRVVGEIMHKEFPQKIFEGSVHNTYSVHYYHGGVPTVLSEKYRRSWQSMADNNVDAVVLTNLFDHWENSLVLPCYERGDFLMRYAEYEMHRIFGKPFRATAEPELVLTNYIDIIPGRRPIRFEVVAFPLAAEVADREVTVTVEVCDSSGAVLHAFPAERLTLDELQARVFELPPERFLDQRAVIPRIVWQWRGETRHGDYNPPTILDTSIRTSWMFWARSTANRVAATLPATDWRINGRPAGATVDWREANGFGVFTTAIAPATAGAVNRTRIMRNGMEWYGWNGKELALGRAFQLPYPGAALNFYWMEMETPAGSRFQTLPIWVDAGARPGKATLPLLLDDERIIGVEVEAARVPFFYYPCEVDSGNLLLDVSGYEHHGRLQKNGEVGYAYGSLQYTGYYHYHNGGFGGTANRHFMRDEAGRGFLRFDGADKDFYMISGGTAFPYAATWELEFRADASGETMYLLGTANNQINIRIEPDGRLTASRGGVHEGPGGAAPKTKATVQVATQASVADGQWHRIAAVYDLRQLKLYCDGVLQEAKAIAPTPEHEAIDHVMLAAGCGFLHAPHSYFTGDIRNVRFYGRNLEEHELMR